MQKWTSEKLQEVLDKTWQWPQIVVNKYVEASSELFSSSNSTSSFSDSLRYKLKSCWSAYRIWAKILPAALIDDTQTQIPWAAVMITGNSWQRVSEIHWRGNVPPIQMIIDYDFNFAY